MRATIFLGWALLAGSAACAPSPAADPTLSTQTMKAPSTIGTGSPAWETPSLSRTSRSTPAPIPDDPLLSTWAGPLPEGARGRLGKGRIKDFDIAPAANLMVVGGSAGLFLYRADSFELIWSRLTEKSIWETAISQDGTRIAIVHITGSANRREITVWDTVKGESLAKIRAYVAKDTHGTDINGIALSPNGRRLAFTCGGYILVYDIDVPGVRQLWTREEEDKFPFSLAFSPDGKILAVGYWSPDGLGMPVPCEGCETTSKAPVILWETESGKRLRALDGHDDDVKAVVFSADGKILASGGDDERVRLWDPESGNLLLTLDAAEKESKWMNYIVSVAVSPDGKTVAAGIEFGKGSPSRIMLWDAAGGSRIRTLDEKAVDRWDDMVGVAFFLDGTLFTGPHSGYDGFTVRQWNPATGGQGPVLAGFMDTVEDIVFLPDGYTLASITDEDAFYLWDWTNGKNKQRQELDGRNSYIYYYISPDGKTLALDALDAEGYPVILLWDIASWRQLSTISPKGINCESSRHSNIVFIPGSGRIAFALCDTITIWDVAGGKEVQRLQEAPEEIDTLAVSPDGKRIAASEGIRLEEPDEYGFNFHPGILVWDTASGRVIHNWPAPEGIGSEQYWGMREPVAFLPDGNSIMYAPYGQLILWSFPDGNPRMITVQDHGVDCVAFSPDGKRLAAGSGLEVLLLDLRTWDILATFRGHASKAKVIRFSTDGKTLATGSDDGTILLWDVPD